MKKSTLFFTALLVPFDFLMLILAGLTAYHLRTSSWVASYRPVLFTLNLPFSRYLELVLGCALFLLIVFALTGLYKMKPFHRLLDDFSRIVIGVSAGIMALVFYIFLRREWFESRFLILAGWFLAVVFVALGRFCFGLLQKYLMEKHAYGLQKVLVIGQEDDISRELIKNIKELPSLGYELVGRAWEIDIREIKEKVRKLKLDGVILANSDWSKGKILKLVRFCENHHLAFKFVPNLFQTLTRNSTIESLEGVPLVEVKRTKLDGWWKIVKRIFDILFSLVFIIVFSWLYLLITLLIKIEDPGAVIYKDIRCGYKKKRFVFYKFRYMKANLCDGAFGTKAGNKMLSKLEKNPRYNLRKGGPLRKASLNDPRITKVGRFIRKFSLDELPQFFNILRGDMSVVGYRPHLPKEVEKYTMEQSKMFCAKPGLTGLAQISGRSSLDFDEEARLDLFYIEHWSFLLDIIIILKTPFVMASEKKKKLPRFLEKRAH